jgi:hypothetical protein
VEYEAVAVLGEHEGNIERRGIVEALLHAIADAVVLSFASMIAMGIMGL